MTDNSEWILDKEC